MSAITAYFIWRKLPYNFKSAKRSTRFAPIFFFLLDQPAQSGLSDGLAKGFQLFARTFRNQLHPPIWEVAHGACDFKPGGQRLHCVAKTDALHAAGVINSYSLPAH